MPSMYKQKTIEGLELTASRIHEMGLADLRDLRTRFQHVDRYKARESDRTSGTLEARRKNVIDGDKSVLRNFEPPIIFSQLDSALAYFTEVFLSGYPIFGVVGTKEIEKQVAAMHALMGRDSERFHWVRELMLAFNDVLSYNVAAVESDWLVQPVSRIGTQFDQQTAAQAAKVEKIEYSGNSLKRLDMYNTFWDQSVDPVYVSENGLYAGHTELKNYIEVRKLLRRLSNEYILHKNVTDALRSTSSMLSGYYVPDVRADINRKSYGTDWAAFFGNAGPKYQGNASGLYEVTTLYIRLIPREYDIVVSQAATPRVFKFIQLNGRTIFAKPLDFAHDLIPIAFMQAYEDGQGLQTKSFCENLMDIQDIGTSLQNGRLKSLRRAVSDRALYDPTRIRKADIDSAQPDSKIPAKLNQYHKDLGSAYYPIPYRDDTGATINQEYQMVIGMSSSATGLNQAMQGNFVKGNRTLSEYDDIAGNAQARLRKMAVLWEATFFTQVKHMIRSNYLQYAINEELVDSQSGERVQVDPVKLREIEMKFKISDGVLPSEKIINAQTLQFALSAMPQFGELQREYKTSDMLVTLIKAAGLPDLSEFRRTEQELQLYDQQQQAAIAAANQQPAG